MVVFGRKVFKAKGAKAVIDFRAKKVLGMPLVSFDGDPKGHALLARRVLRYCQDKGLERVATAVDLLGSDGSMRAFISRLGAHPMFLVVSVNVDRVANGQNQVR